MERSGVSRTCGSCGAGVSADAVTCPACGALLVAYEAPPGSEAAPGTVTRSSVPSAFDAIPQTKSGTPVAATLATPQVASMSGPTTKLPTTPAPRPGPVANVTMPPEDQPLTLPDAQAQTPSIIAPSAPEPPPQPATAQPGTTTTPHVTQPADMPEPASAPAPGSALRKDGLPTGHLREKPVAPAWMRDDHASSIPRMPVPMIPDTAMTITKLFRIGISIVAVILLLRVSGLFGFSSMVTVVFIIIILMNVLKASARSSGRKTTTMADPNKPGRWHR
jgi:hypothetical protein